MALRASVEIGRALVRCNRKLRSEGLDPIRIGLGVHLGNLVVGEIGAAGDAPRTIIGETVNAASRLEAETKSLSVELLISEPVLAKAGVLSDDLPLRELILRGVATPIKALPVPGAAGLEGMIGTIS